MATLAELQSRRDQLIARVESLQSRISHGDKSVEFDLSQAKPVLELLDQEITRANNRGRLIRQVRVNSRKDL